MAKFVVRQGADPGTDIPFDGERLLFGRSDDCDVVVVDANVSRHHAQAVNLDGITAIVDLNSSNGTFVNELPISRAFLMDGDQVRLGETVLVFTEGDRGVSDAPGASPASAPRLGSADISGAAAPPLGAPDHTALFATIAEDVHVDALKEVYLKLKALYRVFQEVAGAPTMKDIFEAVARAITVSTEAERVQFFLNAEKTGGGWEPYLSRMATRIDDRAAARPTSDEVLTRARQDHRPVLAHVDERGRASFAGAEANTIAVPLFRGTVLAALLHADNPGSHNPLSKNDLDFITTLATQIGIRLNQFEQVQQLRKENVQLRQKLDEDFTVVTNDEKMKSIMVITARVAESDATVLISGESGTGKELIARSIHNFSRRGAKQLVAVNCAALTETLLESELFGHEKGSFTGAVDRHIGKFEAADRGTLFLDEIGEISPGAQAKLLRTLEEGEILRVGGNKVIKVDVRLIAATNKDLASEVQAGRFRQDLYFRLKVIEITLPPLRERAGDVPELAAYFLKQLRQKVPTSVKNISPEALAFLSRYAFPGNIRELRNIMERGLVFAHGDTLLPEHLPAEVLGAPAAVGRGASGAAQADDDSEPASLAEMERVHIGRVLEFSGGNKLRAAQILGISRTTLYEKLKAYDLAANDKDE